MKHSREFEIAWQGLKPGVHVYQYELDDRFMAQREAPQEFKNWDAKVTVRFDNHSNFFLLHFDVGGVVTLPCDRCGDDFRLSLWDEFDLLVKLSGEEEGEVEEEDADVVFIPRSETVLDIADWLYEFVMLSVPLQKIHPDNADGTPGCNPEALRLLGQLSEHDEDKPQQPQNDIWKGLQSLKDMAEEDPEKTN